MESIRGMLSGITFNNSSVIVNRDDRQLPVNNNSINYDETHRKTNTNFRATNRGFSANKHKNIQPDNQPFKDPDIWESPPPIEKRQSVQKVSKPVNVSQNRNNYQAKNIPPTKKKGEKVENGGKKTFLNDRYP